MHLPPCWEYAEEWLIWPYPVFPHFCRPVPMVFTPLNSLMCIGLYNEGLCNLVYVDTFTHMDTNVCVTAWLWCVCVCVCVTAWLWCVCVLQPGCGVCVCVLQPGCGVAVIREKSAWLLIMSLMGSSTSKTGLSEQCGPHCFHLEHMSASLISTHSSCLYPCTSVPHLSVCICVYVSVCICVCMYCMRVCLYACLCAWFMMEGVCVCVSSGGRCMCVCVNVCACVCVCVCVCVSVVHGMMTQSVLVLVLLPAWPFTRCV